MPLPDLHTPRLLLRRLRESDLDDLFALFSDSEVMQFSPKGTLTPSDCRAWLTATEERHEKFGHGFLAVQDRQSGRYLGHAGLLAQELNGEPYVEIAYWLRRDAWGHGYATEAARACRDHGLDVMQRPFLVSFIHVDNQPSQRVAERLGMSRAGFAKWKTMDIVIYRIEADAPRP